MRVAVITLGCPKNLVDSEHMLGVLGQAGFILTDSLTEADAIVVNTCGFLEAAVQESRATIRRCLRTSGQRRVRVIAAGCLAQRLRGQLLADFPGLDAVIGIDQIGELARILRRPSSAPGLRVKTPIGVCSARTPRLVSTPRHYAYLRIADGCDNHCSYCVIPQLRGRFRSRTIDDILVEARLLARRGTRELILIAQDTTLYGQERYGRKMLARLLRLLARIPGIEWLRLLYTHPAHYTPELVDEIAVNPRIVKYVDLPLQHVSDRILERMNRGYRRAEVEGLLERLRAIPGMAIRTTFITGFPGETQAEFRELQGFVAAGHFTHVGCFAYSPEPGTRAARMPDQVPHQVRIVRARQLIQAQRRVVLGRNRFLVGSEVPVRIDSWDQRRRCYLGRRAGDAPEIDNTIHVAGEDCSPGSLVSVRITRAGAYRIMGEVARSKPDA